MNNNLRLELGQIKLRFFLVTFISLYIYFVTLLPEQPFDVRAPEFVKTSIVFLFAFNFILSVILLLWLKLKPYYLLTTRRILSSFFDMLAVTSVMYIGDEWGAALYPTYIWIVFGYAFRFGIPYMVVSTFFSVIGFSFIIILTPFWINNVSVSIGLLIGLLILPGYFGVLLAQKNSAIAVKERILANVSHELRTPLNSIIGLSELSTRTRDIDKIYKFMNTVNTSGKHLLKIINDILDTAQFDENLDYLALKTFDLDRLVKDVTKIIQPSIFNKHISFAYHIDPDIPRFIQSDELKIKQILINLLSNSIKFTEQGDITLNITKHKTTKSGIKVKFSISDTGVGISPASIKKIFDGFIQADNTITRKYGGTGLGLSISKALVEKLGGKLNVKSVEGEGTEFWFILNVQPGSAEGDKDFMLEEHNEPHMFASEANTNILIVEDEPVTQEIYKEVFNQAGYQTCIVSDANSALSKLDNDKFSIAIIDHNMPDMSGLELVKILRKKYSSDALPVVSVTADASEKCRTDYQGLSNMHKTKPISPANLLKVVHDLLNQSK